MFAVIKEKEQKLSIIESFKAIFSGENLGEEAAKEHMKNNLPI